MRRCDRRCAAEVLLAVALCSLSPALLQGAEPAVVESSAPAAARRWKAERVLPAPEAVQAAAAEGDFVYAVSSSQIAKYDRASGERVAVSRGEAKHLNSAFVWEGAIYCAHSNYPNRPEHSEIKRLDLQTMELTTYHDFGRSDGSLTWCVREHGSWWCNFAFYGDQNARTRLVRFDDEWRETRVWTYPAEITEHLGRYSLSGGLFLDSVLLATGHDDPVLFRLRLPESGDQLIPDGREAVPFTGQGFATDPATGGLIGIQRSKRQIVFAASETVAP